MSVYYNDCIRVILVFGQISCLIALVVTVGMHMAQLGTVQASIFAELILGFLLLLLSNVEKILDDMPYPAPVVYPGAYTGVYTDEVV